MVRFLLILLLWPSLSLAAETTFPGPITARVIRVIDGDTLLVDADIWLGLRQEIKVRLAGIDAPELKGKCDAERQAALASQAALRRLAGTRVLLSQIHHGKFAERVIARVWTQDGQDISARLLADGMARVYHGGARRGWCAPP